MFLHTLIVERVAAGGTTQPVPLRQLDNFAMRNFTNNADFDDTLPVADGRLEVGSLVPVDRLEAAMEAWFRRKQYFGPDESLRIRREDDYGQVAT